MMRLTEPGATKMWDGWFTVHWIPIIMDMAQRQNNNAKRANTYKLAIATAEKIRNVIKQGLYKMWKIRNEIKHEERVKHKWTKKEIEDILRQLKKSRAIERHRVEEIMMRKFPEKGAKSTPTPPPNGLKWAAEGHAPALLASGSRSRPAETEKTRP